MAKPIVILVILHDDLKDYSPAQLYADYFSWFKTELETVAQREVQIRISPVGSRPLLSCFNYKNEDVQKTLRAWKAQVGELHYQTFHQEHLERYLTKVLLLTRDNLNSRVGGIGAIKDYAAISSIAGYRYPAHELGHTLGATHDDSAIEYDGWWHNSIMIADQFQMLRGNTYRFTEKNRQNIRDFLKKFD